jgi:hypothetical protein
MNSNPEIPEPTAADYRALIDRFNAAARAHNSGEIDFPAFRSLIAQIDEQSRYLNLLRKLHRTCQRVERDKKAAAKSSLNT